MSPTIVGSAFTISNGDEHWVSQFQISTVSDFATTVYDSGYVDDLESHLVDFVLEPISVYYVRCRYLARIGGWGEWSDPVQFTTVANSVNAPTLTVTGTPETVSLEAEMIGSAFALIVGGNPTQLMEWRTLDNVTQLVPEVQMVQISNGVLAVKHQIVSKAWEHKDTLRSMTITNDVVTYDITAGW